MFSLCSARCGVAACLPGLCATGEGATLLAFGASTDAARGDRRVGAPRHRSRRVQRYGSIDSVFFAVQTPGEGVALGSVATEGALTYPRTNRRCSILHSHACARGVAVSARGKMDVQMRVVVFFLSPGGFEAALFPSAKFGRFSDWFAVTTPRNWGNFSTFAPRVCGA